MSVWFLLHADTYSASRLGNSDRGNWGSLKWRWLKLYRGSPPSYPANRLCICTWAERSAVAQGADPAMAGGREPGTLLHCWNLVVAMGRCPQHRLPWEDWSDLWSSGLTSCAACLGDTRLLWALPLPLCPFPALSLPKGGKELEAHIVLPGVGRILPCIHRLRLGEGLPCGRRHTADTHWLWCRHPPVLGAGWEALLLCQCLCPPGAGAGSTAASATWIFITCLSLRSREEEFPCSGHRFVPGAMLLL